MSGWSLLQIVLLILYVLMIIKGLLESKSTSNRFEMPGSHFWYQALVGLAVLIYATPIGK